MKNKGIRSFLGIVMLFILTMRFFNAHSQTLNLLLSNDTLSLHDTLTITNTSTGFLQSDTLYLELDQLVDVDGRYQIVKNTYVFLVNEVKHITYAYPGRYFIRLFKSGQSITRQIFAVESMDSITIPVDTTQLICNNLLLNESFERRFRCQSGNDNLFNTVVNVNNCPFPPGCISYWQNVMPINCNNGIIGLGTPDYFTGSLCPGQNSEYRVPVNFWGIQPAYDDTSYAGIYTTSQLDYANSEWREFIYQNLPQPLQANIPYYASMWVSLAERTNLATRVQMALLDSLCHITTSAIDTGQFQVPLNRIISSPGIITERNNWVKVSGFYTPTNNSTSTLVIGMFNDVPGQATSINFANGYSLNDGGSAAYYYIDYVKLQPITCCAATRPQNNRLIGQNNNRISTLGFTISSGDTLVIADTLIIDQNTTFNNNLVVIMQNGTIRVNSGVTLSIVNSHLRGCDEMWKGIEVLSGGTVTMNNSLLEDAITGISSTQGASVSIHQSLLRKNLTHISLSNFSGNYPFAVTATTFDCSETLKFPHLNQYTRICIYAESAGTVSVGNPNDPIFINTFKNARYGIYGYQTNMTIKNNLFQNISCVQTNQPCLEDGSAAIFVTNAKNSNSIIVNIGGDLPNEQNKFSNCRTGIFIQHNVHANIIRNNFYQIGFRGVFVRRCNQNLIVIRNNDLQVQRQAVYLDNNGNAKIYIQRNTINSYTTSIMSGADTYGIFATEQVMNTQNNVRLIEYNTIRGYNHGIYFSVCYNPQIWNNRIYEEASIRELKNGIWLQACFVPIVARNTIQGELFTNMSQGIRQDNSPVSQTICNDVEFKTIDLSHNGFSLASTLGANYMRNSMVGIFVNQGSVGDQGPNGLAHMNGWFPFQSNPSPWLAHIVYNSNVIDNYELRIPGSPWHPVDFRYTDLSLNPINNTNTSNVLSQIAPFVYGCRVLNWSTGDTTGTSTGNEATLMRLMHDNDSLLADSLSAWWMGNASLYKLVIRQEEEITSPQLALFKQTWDTSATAQLAKWEKWMAEMSDSLLLFNGDSIQPTKASDEYHKKVLQVHHQWLQADSLAQEQAIISQHAQDLEAIARLCPYQEGDAVYMARNLLRLLYPDTMFTDTCEVVWLPIYDAKFATVASDNNVNHCSVNVAPVPARENIQISIACMDEITQANIKITDVAGTVIYTNNWSESLSQLHIPVENWKPGVYFYQVWIDEKHMYHGKLEVVR